VRWQFTPPGWWRNREVRAGTGRAVIAKIHQEVANMRNAPWFTRMAKKTAQLCGRPAAFGLAFGTILAWLVTGPLFGFSDTWQLVINTGTTIVTFLMVFLIQNTQNRDTAAIQIKLDELIRVSRAHNALMDLEELEEAEIEVFRRKYQALAALARRQINEGFDDTNSTEPA
jgi:low affinity Fe/Cu permease